MHFWHPQYLIDSDINLYFMQKNNLNSLTKYNYLLKFPIMKKQSFRKYINTIHLETQNCVLE